MPFILLVVAWAAAGEKEALAKRLKKITVPASRKEKAEMADTGKVVETNERADKAIEHQDGIITKLYNILGCLGT